MTRSIEGCRFIEGELDWSARGDAIYCGERRKDGSPYCPDHHARCYKAPSIPTENPIAVNERTGRPFR